jgi:hypothetical protein
VLRTPRATGIGILGPVDVIDAHNGSDLNMMSLFLDRGQRRAE